MSVTIQVVKVEWIKPPEDGDCYPVLARCENCHEDAAEDLRNGHKVRAFFKVLGGNDDGTILCEHCVEQFIMEQL